MIDDYFTEGELNDIATAVRCRYEMATDNTAMGREATLARMKKREKAARRTRK